MNFRLIELRKSLNLNQEDFGKKLQITKSHISSLENGRRIITDRTINDICRVFNVSEEWIRHGLGNMFLENNEITLDEYAKQNNATPLEVDLIKAFLSINPDERERIIKAFKKATIKNNAKTTNTQGNSYNNNTENKNPIITKKLNKPLHVAENKNNTSMDEVAISIVTKHRNMKDIINKMSSKSSRNTNKDNL